MNGLAKWAVALVVVVMMGACGSGSDDSNQPKESSVAPTVTASPSGSVQPTSAPSERFASCYTQNKSPCPAFVAMVMSVGNGVNQVPTVVQAPGITITLKHMVNCRVEVPGCFESWNARWTYSDDVKPEAVQDYYLSGEGWQWSIGFNPNPTVSGYNLSYDFRRGLKIYASPA